MKFIFLFIYVMKYFVSSSNIIEAKPHKRIIETVNYTKTLYFSFSLNSYLESNLSTVNFDFYKGSRPIYLYIYLNYSQFLEDKSNGYLSYYYRKYKIEEEYRTYYYYDMQQVQINVTNISTIYFAIEYAGSSSYYKTNKIMFQVYDFFNLINVENNFYSQMKMSYEFIYPQFLYIKLKKFSSPIYCHVLFYQNASYKFEGSSRRNYILNVYKDSILPENIIKSSNTEYSVSIINNLYLSNDTQYYLSLFQNQIYNSETFIIYIFYSNLPNFSFDVDDNNFYFPFFTSEKIYYYKNITDYFEGEEVNIQLSLINYYNISLESKPSYFHIFHSEFETLDFSKAPLIDKEINLTKGKMDFTIRKKSIKGNYIIFKIDVNPIFLDEVFGKLEIPKFSTKTLVIIGIIVFVVFGSISFLVFSLEKENLKKDSLF